MDYKIGQAWCTGKLHREKGQPCQDKVHLVRREELFCAALADGAGSETYSEFGAECVSICVTELVSERFDELWKLESEKLAELLIGECLNGLFRLGLPIEEVGSTLHFFAGHRDGRYLSGHLGDGVQILVSGDDEALSVFSEPENGKYLNETYFVTSDDAKSHLRLRRGELCGTGAFLMMSDGTAECLYRREDKMPAEGCRTIAGWLRSGDEMTVNAALRENMEEVFSRYSADDMSISVIVWDGSEETCGDLPDSGKENFG